MVSVIEGLHCTCIVGTEEHDKEGRVITAEYEKFYFVTTYVPNSGDKLKRFLKISVAEKIN